MIAVGLAGMLAACSAQAMTIAKGGYGYAAIVLAADATSAEKTAAREVCEYLGKVTGAKFAVGQEGGSLPDAVIYVGSTRYAAAYGIKPSALGPEEWVVKTVGRGLIIAGGRPRGTLYAAYHFLEDVVGVHWWNPFEETVPSKPTLTIGNLDRRGKPVLRYRDIYMLWGNDNGRFAARNRLNRQGDATLTGDYGGSMDYGPPYHVHTFYMYAPPETYFKDHPEWYSLVDGKRTGAQAQLCLTNQELRDFFVAKLKAYIEDARKRAAEAGSPAPIVYNISQNDWGGACQCDKCQAIAKAEGSEIGPILDFVNYIADAIRTDYPGVDIDTLAYSYSQQAPKTIRPRDNVIIRLCDTGSNFTVPITDDQNRPFREQVTRWGAIAKNLRIWKYAVTYVPYTGFPMPTVHAYPTDFKFLVEHHVEGIFTELEYPVTADWRDFKVWMMMKLEEDPYQNYQALVRTFTDGFYGPAGPMLREYLTKLEAASAAKPSFLGMGGSPLAAQYLDLDFLRGAEAIFDRAEAACKGDTVLLRRVRHARLPVDRAVIVLYPRLMNRWVGDGNAPEKMPLDRDVIAARAKATWIAQADFRLPPGGEREGEKASAEAEITALTARKAYVPLPERFRNLPAGTVFDFTAEASRNWLDQAKVVPDADTECGITDRLELRDDDQEPSIHKYGLPIVWGLYDQIGKKQPVGGSIKPEDVPGSGYNWYKLGTSRVGPSFYFYFFWSWIIQIDVDSICDPKHPDQQFDVWAKIKFEGPAFPHGQPGEKNAISVERIVFVKTKG